VILSIAAAAIPHPPYTLVPVMTAFGGLASALVAWVTEVRPTGRRRGSAATYLAEMIFSVVVCVSLGIVFGLILVLMDLSEGGVFAVVAIGGSLAGLVAGQMTVRVDRRRRDRVH